MAFDNHLRLDELRTYTFPTGVSVEIKLLLRSELENFQNRPPPIAPPVPRQTRYKDGRAATGGNNPGHPLYKKSFGIYERNIRRYQLAQIIWAFKYIVKHKVVCPPPPAWWLNNRNSFYSNEEEEKELWVGEQIRGIDGAGDFIDSVIGQIEPVESEIQRSVEKHRSGIQRGEQYTPAGQYQRKKKRSAGIVYPSKIEEEIARKELGYSPEVWYSLSGVPMWVPADAIIPYSRSELIGFNRVINEANAIDMELSEEDRKSKPPSSDNSKPKIPLPRMR